MLSVEQSFLRCKAVLMKKRKEYSKPDGDRLIQFKKTAMMEDKNPAETLFSMADKHITSIADMVKEPNAYTTNQWREKIGDLHNYLFLLDAVLIDMEVIEE
jgi:hypothetical protein